MTRGSFFYGVWSLAVVGAFLFASMRGYSPFADGRRVAPGVGPGGGVIYGGGPRHK